MSQDQSPDELEQERVQVMGPQLGPLYHALYNELAWLNMKWQEFKKLYAHSPERVELLNRTAQAFFWQLQDIMWKDVLLHLARIVDAPGTGRKTNLTIRRLHLAIPDRPLADDVERLVDEAVSRSSFAKDWRDRRLAHNDLDLKLNRAVKPLEPASRKRVEDALEAIANALGRLHTHYFHSETVFSPIRLIGDAEALVGHLAVAAQTQERRLERLRCGRPLPEDLQPPPEA